MIKLYRFLKPFTFSVIAVILLVFIQTLAELFLPTLMAGIVDIGIINGDTSYIINTGGLMLLIAAMGTACAILASYLAARTAVGLGQTLRSRIFFRTESFSLEEFDRFGTATLITRTTNDINQVQLVTFTIMRLMVSAPLMCIGGIIMALAQDRALTLVILGAIPVIVLVVGAIIRRAMPLFHIMQKKIDGLNLVLREGLSGIRIIRAFNRVEDEQARFDQANTELMENAIKINKLMAALMPAMMLIMNLALIAIIWFGSIRIDHGNMQIGSLMAFIQYAMMIMMSLVMLSMLFIMVPRASVSAARINEVLETIPRIKSPEQARTPPHSAGWLEFRNVTFSFPGTERPALSNISFQARPGETTAIIGGTGTGKSALISLIPRFYDVDEGSILLDKVDIREMSLESLRAKIGYVPQKAILFTGTIAENIRCGKLDATDAEIRQAADTAQALDFISDMEHGFDAMIEQGGTNVSGGQRQRLTIARALVRKPQIYIFDDSFSALDFKTDARLRAALKKVTSSATVLIIAQRITTVMEADQIIVLEDGKRAGIGTHDELMESCAIYREIVYSQLSEEELA